MTLKSPAAAFEDIVGQIQASSDAGRPVAVGAAVFGGGFSFGVEQAGYDVAGVFELTDLAFAAQTASQRWNVCLSGEDQWPKYARELKSTGLNEKIDFFYMNPPCAAYSKQGAREGMESNLMNFTISCVKFARDIRPKAFAWELVPGIWDDKTGGGRELVLNEGRACVDLGYRVYVLITSTALHGGFQNRERFHFVASQTPISWEGTYAADKPEHKGSRLLGDALAIVEEAERNGVPLYQHVQAREHGGSLLALLPYCPPGAYLRDISDEIMRAHYRPFGKEWNGESRAGVAQVRGRRDRVCPVITGGHSVVHPELDRFLTVREAATVMGFPLDYQFSDSGSAGYAEVGKGLTTHNSSFIARAVLRSTTSWAMQDPESVELPEITDWRGKADVASMPMTEAERRVWFSEHHPKLPVEWSDPRPKGKPGRPIGHKPANKPSKLPRVPTVMLFGPSEWRVGTRERLFGTVVVLDSAPKGAEGLTMVFLHPEADDKTAAFCAGYCHALGIESVEEVTQSEEIARLVGVDVAPMLKQQIASQLDGMTPAELAELMRLVQARKEVG